MQWCVFTGNKHKYYHKKHSSNISCWWGCWSRSENRKVCVHDSSTKIRTYRHLSKFFESVAKLKYSWTPSKVQNWIYEYIKRRLHWKNVCYHLLWLLLCFHLISKNIKINHTIITNVMHWILFIHKILLLSSTCFEYQVLIFRRT